METARELGGKLVGCCSLNWSDVSTDSKYRFDRGLT